MIKVLGIIAEYNPFHNGHLYHLQQSAAQLNPDYIIVVMSGHFTQRGEATIIDKWSRTAIALKSGVDLVLELPAAYACQTAELFAFGSVQLLNNTGIVTHLTFGSEVANIEALDAIASILAIEPDEYKQQLRSQLKNGLSYPVARLRALEQYININKSVFPYPVEYLYNIMASSNSILAIEYLKALKRTHSSIQAFPIQRVGSFYNDIEMSGKFSSATAIRNHLISGKNLDDLKESLPPYSLEVLKRNMDEGRGPVSNHSLEQIIMGIIRRSSADEIGGWMDVEEGLENRIKEYGNSCSSLNEFLTQAKTKRYVYTRLQRILIHGLLGITTNQMKEFQQSGGPCYLRILGFRKKSLPLLAHLKNNALVPIITKPADYFHHDFPLLNKMFELDVMATDIYCLGFPGQYQQKGGQDFTHPLVII